MDFYNNRDILNGDITPGGATYGTANKAHAKYMRTVYEEVINSAQVDSTFVPLEMPDPGRKMRTLLPEDCDIQDPISFFELFFGEEQYELLAKNTNKYAAAYPEQHPDKRPRF